MLVLFFAGTNAHAAGSGNVSISDANGSRGEEVIVRVELTQNPGLISLRLQVNYPEGIVLQSVENSGILNGWTAPSPTVFSPYTLRWADAFATANNTATGTIATLRFKISDTAIIGANSITVEVVESRDKDGEKNSFNSASATITVTDPSEQPSSEPEPETQPVAPSTNEAETQSVEPSTNESETQPATPSTNEAETEESSENAESTIETETETEEEPPVSSSAESETEEEITGDETDPVPYDSTVESEIDGATWNPADPKGWILPVVLGGAGVLVAVGAAILIAFIVKKKK